MKKGQYITERYLPDFVVEAAAAQGVYCEVMSDGWVLRLTRGPAIRWVVGYQFDLNPAAASALAQDKVATHLALRQAGVASVPHQLVRSLPHESDLAQHLRDLQGGAFLIKPLDGTGGRGIHKLERVAEAVALIQASDEVAWAASPFYELAAEYRVVLLDGEPLIAYEKTEPVEQYGMRFFNLGMGAVAREVTDAPLLGRLTTMARITTERLGLRVASVDIVRTQAGELLVLEVNDGIMMENYARQSPRYKQRAAAAYDAIVAAMFAPVAPKA